MRLISRAVQAFVVLHVIVIIVIWSNLAKAGTIDEINAADGLGLEEKRSCAVKMCGEPLPTIEIPNRLRDAHTRIFEREFKSALDLLLNANLEEAKLYFNIENSASELQNLELSTLATGIVNFFWATHRAAEIEDFLDLSGGTLKVRAGFETKLPNLSADDQKAVKAILEDFFSQTEVRQGRILEEHDLTTAMRMLFQDQLAKSSLEQVKLGFAQNANTKFQKLKQIWPEFPFKAPRALKIMMEGKEPNSAQVKDLGSSLSQLALINIIEDQKGIYRSRSPNLGELLPSVTTSSEFKALKNSLGSAETLKSNAMQACRDSVGETFRVHLTERDFPAAKILAEQVRSSATAVVKHLFKDDAQLGADLAKVLSEISVGLPKTTKEQVAHFRSALATELRESSASLRALKNGSPELRLIYLLLNKPTEGESLFSETEKFCKSNNLETISDHAIPSLKILNAGWETVRYPETGRAIIAHEFGHHLYAVLDNADFIAKILGQPSKKTEKFAKLRQCLAAKHGEQSARADSSNEDFADWFASKVAVHLKSQGFEVRNKGCLLLNGGVGEYGRFNGISLKWPEGYDDVHSPSFFRLLEFDIERRKAIPAQCRATLTKVLPRASAKSCGF